MAIKLVKMDAKDLKPDIAYSIIRGLEDHLFNHKELSKEDVTTIIANQDEDGSFRLFTGQWCHDSDVILDVDYRVTYLCTLLLINSDESEASLSSIDKAFDYIRKRGLAGKGYDAVSDEIDNVTMFLEHGLIPFIDKHHPRYNKFFNFIDVLIYDYKTWYDKGKVTVGWGEDVTDKIKHILDLFNRI